MINFLKYRWLYFLISLFVIGAGLFSIAKWGFRYSIDFTGGSNFEFQMNKVVEKSKIQKVLDLNKISVVNFKLQEKNIILRTKVLDQNKESLLKKDLEAKLKIKITVLRSETVGPILGKEAISKTLIASILAIIGILIYMSFAFKGFNFAFSAVLAMFHDLLVVVGTYSLLGHFFGAEVDTMFVTAVLTTMSFSVHDTIVIFSPTLSQILRLTANRILDRFQILFPKFDHFSYNVYKNYNSYNRYFCLCFSNQTKIGVATNGEE